MTTQAKDLMNQAAPWKRGVSWIALGVEGAILAVIGLFLILSPDTAQTTVRTLIGAIVLANAVLRVLAEFRAPEHPHPGTALRMLAAGVGFTVGLLVVAQPISENLSAKAAIVILALGMVMMALIDLVGVFVSRAQFGGIRWGAVLKSVLLLTFAVFLFSNSRRETVDIEVFGWIALGFGVALGAYAFYLYRNPAAEAEESEIVTAAADPAAPAEPSVPSAASVPSQSATDISSPTQ